MQANSNGMYELVHSPESSSMVFWLGAVHSVRIAWELNPPEENDPQMVEKIHLVILPLSITTTLVARWMWRPARPQHSLGAYARKITLGFALGCGSVALAYGSAYCLGWIKFEPWVWQRHSVRDILRYQGLALIGLGAVAFNEEMVYRGYGYDVLEQLYGPQVATLFTTIIFTLWHELSEPVIDTFHYILGGPGYLHLKQMGTLALP